jgi:hypothetical protein
MFLLMSAIIFLIFTAGRCFQPDKMVRIIIHKGEFIGKIVAELLAVVRVSLSHGGLHA